MAPDLEDKVKFLNVDYKVVTYIWLSPTSSPNLQLHTSYSLSVYTSNICIIPVCFCSHALPTIFFWLTHTIQDVTPATSPLESLPGIFKLGEVLFFDLPTKPQCIPIQYCYNSILTFCLYLLSLVFKFLVGGDQAIHFHNSNTQHIVSIHKTLLN